MLARHGQTNKPCNGVAQGDQSTIEGRVSRLFHSNNTFVAIYNNTTIYTQILRFPLTSINNDILKHVHSLSVFRTPTPSGSALLIYRCT
jgi:hypothetical protein